MYHCHLHFYFAGQHCGVFEMIKETAPLASFTHEFSWSGETDEALLASADVIFVNLAGTSAGELRKLASGKRREAELVLLAEEGRLTAGGVSETEIDFWRAEDILAEVSDVWKLPMSEAEVRFRILRWQQA